MHTGSRRAKRGYLYLAVLATAVVVSTMGITALSVAALKLRSATTNRHWTEAELLAQSALEEALLLVKNDNGWRTKHNPNQEYPNSGIELGSGKYTYKFVDEDGSLNDDDADSVKVIGIGRVGEATVAQSVRLLPAGAPLTCLDTSFHVENSITLSALINFSTTQIISTNDNCSASAFLAKITGNVEAAGTISGSVTGTQTANAAERKMPTTAAFEYYEDNGTWIKFSSLPTVNSVATIEKTLLSPQSNPYGTAKNLEGIYVIDCGGQKLCIQDCRIQGTLVLLNPHANSQVKSSVCWSPAVANYPALLVDGSIEFQTNTTTLSEATISANLNPPGTPYAGNENTTMADSYPSEINGITYVSGTFNLSPDSGESAFRGVAICNSVTAASPARFFYRSYFKENPPPGFSRGNPMMVSPGSRKRESL